MKAMTSKLLALLMLAIFCSAGISFADLNNNEVQFTGVVKSVQVNGQSEGTLFVTLDTIDLRVIVNSKTIIQDLETDIITMDDLASLKESANSTIDLMVEVTGKFSSSGILAGRVRVVGEASDFNIRGHITGIQFPSDTEAQISLLGITVSAALEGASAVSVQMNGVDVPVSELKNGTKVEVSGKITEKGIWSADQIEILSAAKKKGLVFFEGKVQSYAGGTGSIDVAVTGATNNVTTVFITPETVIQGTLATNAYVLVIGTINPNASFNAKEIRVLGALEIKPDERKVAIGATATFTIKLRESAAAKVTVTLAVAPAGILEPLSANTLEIPVGSQTADFQVKGLGAGTAVITATALNEQATATVVVGLLPEDDTERPPDQTRIAFSPDHIKLNPNETREVVLHIQPPPKVDVELQLTSSAPDIVPIPTTRILSNGAATFKVTIQSAGDTGQASIIAKLPDAFGGGEAELIVEVEAKKGK